MNIGLDVSPIKGAYSMGHRVRGTGFYIQNLKDSLLLYFPKNNYTFFTRAEKLPDNLNVVHYPYFEPFFVTLPFKKKARTVVTIHDLTPFVFPEHFPSGIKGQIKWLIQKTNLGKADAIIADSEASKKDIVKYANISPDKITVVYLAAGKQFQIIKPQKPRIHDLKNKYNLPEKFALYVGDVTWNKNLVRLIEAIKKTSIPLVMAGKALVEENFDRNNLWNQDLYKVQNLTQGNKQFILPGFVSEEELIELYNLATVFVMPSLYEGFGLPILEAMSCGCQVVTSQKGSLPEVAGEAAYYIDPEDVESIAKGVREVFSNENLRKELIKKGLAQAEKFSWEKTAIKTFEVYKNVV